jgi:hypothetical protein
MGLAPYTRTLYTAAGDGWLRRDDALAGGRLLLHPYPAPPGAHPNPRILALALDQCRLLLSPISSANEHERDGSTGRWRRAQDRGIDHPAARQVRRHTSHPRHAHLPIASYPRLYPSPSGTECNFV